MIEAASTSKHASQSLHTTRLHQGRHPSKSNRKKKIHHDNEAYKKRNVVERCFCRLKDFRRIATRYDKLAQNFFSALCFVATLAFWI